MQLPDPVPGLVIRYGFLWSREQRAAQEEGKDRPAAILLLTEINATAKRVYVLAITHSAPRESARESVTAIEIPHRVKRHLGLDDARSWIVLDEVNDFIWPGFDLSPVPASNPARIDYGMLPPAFFNAVRDAFVALYNARRVKVVKRE